MGEKSNTSTQLIRFDAARRALAEARSIDEVKDVRDKAEAIRLYAKQAKLGLGMVNDAAEIKLRAERRAGEMLAEMKANGERHTPGGNQKAKSQPVTLSDVGIEPMQASRWQAIASIPDDQFEKTITEVKNAQDAELTTAAMLRMAKEIKRTEMFSVRHDVELEQVAHGMYSVILADPPWQYSNSGLNGSAEGHYPTMETGSICSLPIKDYVTDNAVIFLWVTNPLLPDGLQVMKAWGFEYKTNFVWVKDRSNYGKLGFYNYGRHELLLVGVKGSYLPECSDLPVSVIEAPKSIHSRKPDEVYKLIESMYPNKRKLEMFARGKRTGWDAFGNEVN